MIAVFRYMPPTSPVAPGFCCISIVFARTIVGGEDHGIKPYVFQLHDGQSMTPGVKIKYATISHHAPLAVN
jgi:acyl-CoA oxidase